MRLQTQLNEAGVLGVVVVVFSLNTRVGEMLNLYLQPEFLAAHLHHLSQFKHIELLCELVEHPELARLRWIHAGNLDAAHCVANVKEAASLATLAIYR